MIHVLAHSAINCSDSGKKPASIITVERSIHHEKNKRENRRMGKKQKAWARTLCRLIYKRTRSKTMETGWCGHDLCIGRSIWDRTSANDAINSENCWNKWISSWSNIEEHGKGYRTSSDWGNSGDSARTVEQKGHINSAYLRHVVACPAIIR